MKYFAVVGRNDYWKYELEMIGAVDVKDVKRNIVTFELEIVDSRVKKGELGGLVLDNFNFESLLSQCSQIIKRGKTMSKSDLFLDLKGTKIIGIDQKKYGTDIKKSVKTIKRFKQIEILHSDLEIKNDGKEVICIDGSKNIWGVVRGYQNISLFERVDFEKPFSGMKVGMMPSKLALFLVNLGINKKKEQVVEKKNKSEQERKMTIWDPFAGFGTTGFVANYFGYNFIGSDLKITSLKGNWKWRNLIKNGKGKIKNETENIIENNEITGSLHTQEGQLFDEKTPKKAFFTIFKHDVTNFFKQKFLTNVDVIATEGRLGPILKNNYLPLSFLEECQEKVRKVQKGFLNNLLLFFSKDNFPVISMTIPYYFQNDTSNVKKIRERCQKFFLDLEVLDDIYHRKRQLVGRQIVIISKKGKK